MSGPYRFKMAGIISLIALINVLVLLTDWTMARYLGALLLLCLLPGYALVDLLLARSKPQSGPLEKVVLSVGASYALSSLATLIVHYIPGEITLAQALVAYDLLILVPLALGYLIAPPHPSAQPPNHLATQPPNYLWLVALLSLSAFFRFTGLGYSDFQGDEALVMLTAADAIAGQDYALFAHGKGPGEVLIPVAFWLTTGRINELAARFPFALAGCLAILTTCLLGWRMFNQRVGLAAGALLAINGFFVGFGRIVQYQTLVFAMTALALYCYYRFYTDDVGQYQILGALFLAFGLLAHYDAVLALPAILYLYWAKSGLKFAPYQRHILPLALSLVLLISIPIAFYLPFVRDPQFTKSASYISESRVGSNVLNNNLSQFYLLSTIYNSTYYFASIALLVLWVVVKGLHHRRGGYLWSCLAAAALASVLAFPDKWQVGKVNLALVPFALTWLALHTSPKTSTELKTALIWLATPFVFYIFLMNYPLTHVYNLYPGWALLSGVALDGLGQTKPSLRYALGAAGGILYAVFAYYILFVFVIHEPEYIRTYPAHRNRFYWTAYDELPQAGYFGFPYRAGWKVVGQLHQEGVLQGEHDSNEEREITTWYTRRAPRSCSPDPDHYYIAENVADEQEVPWDSLATDYTLLGTVLVGDDPKLRIYQRLPTQADAITYHVEDFETAYNRSATPENFAQKAIPDHALSVNLSHKVKLLGYDLDTREAKPGGVLILTLYWQALAKMDISYHVFTHLESDRIWGQNDGVPRCWRCPTTEWRPGQVIADRRRIPIDPQVPAGTYPLVVGLYELESGQRLEVIDEAGNPQAQSVLLTEVDIAP
ncbi:MAG: glycosyltransferase family 39 protein [Anaerolineae bacterium]